MYTNKPTGLMCGRCHAYVNDRWTQTWPNYGHIRLGFSAQIGYALGLRDAFPDSINGFKSGKAQEVVLEWGQGYEYDTRCTYVLCASCQEALLKLIGEFFGERPALTPDKGGPANA
jgi:hypothetical protein